MKTVLEQLSDVGISNTMPAPIKKKWLKALRSGKYEQGTGELYTSGVVDSNGKEHHPQFCCLGVLEHCLTGGVEFDSSDFSMAVPSLDFMKDYGIEFIDGEGGRVGNPQFIYAGSRTDAAELNDDTELTFKQIANIIEKQVKTK